MNRHLYSGVLVLVALLLGVAGPGHAALYGDFATPGGRITYLGVADVNGLFGAPTVDANSLIFTPSNFEVDCASSASCPPTPASVNDILTFDADADPGVRITRLLLNEEGTTLLDDFNLPSAFAATTVVGNVFIDITELDGVAVSGINVNANMNFTSQGTYDTSTEGNGTHLWTGVMALNIDNFLAANGYAGQHATRINVSLANTLTAFADNGATASIRKDQVRGLAIKVVPEPGTALLIGLGLAGLASGGRRSRA